ncbi:hypothetical protein [Clostridium botulinum]|uniref:hypothetical protein n=1 Tax=Clostridium botulinum TaxID=1491 RepID=UPI0002DB85B9|nr:hypothetical protein [Clostridium botulinum]KLU74301.1 hypothetical protein CBC3_p0303 [Clostridium botulinum V891]
MYKEKILEVLNKRGNILFNNLVKTMEWGLEGLSKIPKTSVELMEIKEVEKSISNYYTFTEAGLRTMRNFLNMIWNIDSYVIRTEYWNETEVPESTEDFLVKKTELCDTKVHLVYYKINLKLLDLIDGYFKKLYVLESEASKNIFSNIPNDIRKKYDFYKRFDKLKVAKLKQIAQMNLRKEYINHPLEIFNAIKLVPSITGVTYVTEK